jgi:hypothetical protein
MGQTLIQINAMAGTGALADQAAFTGDHHNPHPGGVGHTPAAFAVPAHRPFVFRHAAGVQGEPVPAIKAKDPVCLSNHLPALQIADAQPALLPVPHLGAIERSDEQLPLTGAES